MIDNPEVEAETFGLPPTVPHLIGKLRNMDPALLADIQKQVTR